MYCIALMEFRLTPEYINENWTEELFYLMLTKRADYIRRQHGEATAAPSGVTHKVSDAELFSRMGQRELTPDEFRKRFGGGNA